MPEYANYFSTTYIEWGYTVHTEYAYDYDEIIEYSVSFSDGTTAEGTGAAVYKDDEFFSLIEFTDDQSENPWSVGVHTVTAALDGVECQFEVVITDAEIEFVSVDVFPVDYENDYKYVRDDDYTSDTYGSYYKYYDVKCDVSYSDNEGINKTTFEFGEVVKSFFTCGGYIYEITYSDDQSAENEWGMGVHTAQIYFLGNEYSIFPEIVDLPSIQSFSVSPIEIVERTHIFNCYYYDEDTDDYTIYGYEYQLDDFIEYEVVTSDGRTISGNGRQVEIDGNYYYIELYGSLTDKNSFVGKNYLTASLN